MLELGASLNSNFDRIDKNRDGQLSCGELKGASEGHELSVADRALAKFASEHVNELASLFNGFNKQTEERRKSEQVRTSPEPQNIERLDINVLLRAAGNTTVGDPFDAFKKIRVGGWTAAGAGYGAYSTFAAGPVGAIAGTAIGGGFGWGFSKLTHRMIYGSSDSYYQQKSNTLQNMDLSKFPRR